VPAAGLRYPDGDRGADGRDASDLGGENLTDGREVGAAVGEGASAGVVERAGLLAVLQFAGFAERGRCVRRRV